MERVQMRRNNSHNKKDLECDIRNRNTHKSEWNPGYLELSKQVKKRGKHQFGKVKTEAVWIQIQAKILSFATAKSCFRTPISP